MSALFLLLTAMLLSLDAAAQGPPPGAGGPPGGGRGPGRGTAAGPIGMLLQNENFKKDVGLNEEQVGKLQKIIEESRPPRPERGQGDQGQRPTPPSFEDIEKRIDDVQVKVNAVLTPEQQQKVKVLSFQLSGGLDSPFLGSRTLAVLDLTAEQKAKLKEISAKRQSSFQNFDFRNASQEERTKRFAEMEASNKGFTEQIKGILTADQKAKAEKLTAESKDVREKFGIPAPGQRGDRGGDRQRGDDRRGGNRDGDGYRPGADSWRPGKGVAGDDKPADSTPRRTFPRSEN
jgi:Spy/CpxP family protein refolding chaperone